MRDKKAVWEALGRTLASLDTVASRAADEPRGAFQVSRDDFGGPQGDLPMIQAFAFSVSPVAAKTLDDLANMLREAGAKYGITIHPAHIGIKWDATDNPSHHDRRDIVWADGNQGLPLSQEIWSWFGNEESSAASEVSTFEFHITPYGGVWFHVDMDGPSTADVPISREVLREIAEGPAQTASPGM